MHHLDQLADPVGQIGEGARPGRGRAARGLGPHDGPVGLDLLALALPPEEALVRPVAAALVEHLGGRVAVVDVRRHQVVPDDAPSSVSARTSLKP